MTASWSRATASSAPHWLIGSRPVTTCMSTRSATASRPQSLSPTLTGTTMARPPCRRATSTIHLGGNAPTGSSSPTSACGPPSPPYAPAIVSVAAQQLHADLELRAHGGLEMCGVAEVGGGRLHTPRAGRAPARLTHDQGRGDRARPVVGCAVDRVLERGDRDLAQHPVG